MGNTFGRSFRVTTFGESHGPAVGAVIDGCPPGLELGPEDIQPDLERRRPGRSPLESSRKEPDQVEILSGIYEGRSLGSPIALLVRNQDARPADYADLSEVFRPGHADYATEAKYGIRDHRGGGRASARETVARVAAGAIARKYLSKAQGVEVVAWVDSIGAVRTEGVDPERVTRDQVDASLVRCPEEETSIRMVREIEAARDAKDSVGSIVGCVARSVPAGLGEPVFDKLTADLAKALMSIPAARGFEIGEGFASSSMRGSVHNDRFRIEEGRPRTERNLAGGVHGGISNGETSRMRVSFKPPPTIAIAQETATRTGKSRMITAEGRHDPCVGPRAVPVVEAMVLLVLADHLLRQRVLAKED